MEVGVPVIIGVAVALGTMGIAAVAPRALAGLWLRLPRRGRDRVETLSGLVVARTILLDEPRDPILEPADQPPAPVAVPDAKKPKVRTPRRSKQRTAALEGGTDVQGHRVLVALPAAEPNSQVAETALGAESPSTAESQSGRSDPEDDFWRANGSTDCPACSSSRLRHARYCLRCGRLLA